MGGPWRVRDFDPVAWRPPVAQPGATDEADRRERRADHLTGIVIGYVISVATSVAIILALLKRGF